MPDLDVTRPWSLDTVVGVDMFARVCVGENDRRLIDEALNAVEALAELVDIARDPDFDAVSNRATSALELAEQVLSRIRGTEAQQDGN